MISNFSSFSRSLEQFFSRRRSEQFWKQNAIIVFIYLTRIITRANKNWAHCWKIKTLKIKVILSVIQFCQPRTNFLKEHFFAQPEIQILEPTLKVDAEDFVNKEHLEIMEKEKGIKMEPDAVNLKTKMPLSASQKLVCRIIYILNVKL